MQSIAIGDNMRRLPLLHSRRGPPILPILRREYSRRQAAELLGIGLKALDRLIRGPELTAHRHDNGRIYIPVESMDAYVARRGR